MEPVSSASNLLAQAMKIAGKTAENPYQFSSEAPTDGLKFPDAAMMQQLGLKDLPQLPTSGTPLAAMRATGEAGTGFSQMIGSLASDVSTKGAQAAAAVNGMMTEQGIPIHQAMIAIQESSVSFQLMVEVRNKLLESYQELMRMQV
jgi:flagellar hook-basal body complex protein FliE